MPWATQEIIIYACGPPTPKLARRRRRFRATLAYPSLFAFLPPSLPRLTAHLPRSARALSYPSPARTVAATRAVTIGHAHHYISFSPSHCTSGSTTLPADSSSPRFAHARRVRAFLNRTCPAIQPESSRRSHFTLPAAPSYLRTQIQHTRPVLLQTTRSCTYCDGRHLVRHQRDIRVGFPCCDRRCAACTETQEARNGIPIDERGRAGGGGGLGGG
jgi:hypothetical protein